MKQHQNVPMHGLSLNVNRTFFVMIYTQVFFYVIMVLQDDESSTLMRSPNIAMCCQEGAG